MKKTLNIILFCALLLSPISLSAEQLRSSDDRFINNVDKTIWDTYTGLMWVKNDSWGATGKCMDWKSAKSYVKNLTTGGYTDWRVPTIDELEGIFETHKSNHMGGKYKNWRKKHPLHLDSIFGNSAAYWLWSLKEDGTCCARLRFFANDLTFNIKLFQDACGVNGVRAVRDPEAVSFEIKGEL